MQKRGKPKKRAIGHEYRSRVFIYRTDHQVATVRAVALEGEPWRAVSCGSHAAQSDPLTPYRTRRQNTTRQTQNMGVGYAPTPTGSSGEPPGTRTLNPLIKSQMGPEMMAPPRNLSGLDPLANGLPRKVGTFLTTPLRPIVHEFRISHKKYTR